MVILGIDSSSLVASAAILKDDSIVAEYTVNFKKTHSQTLLPMIEEIFKMTGIAIEDIDAIAIAGGPGSFTGLRIGSATAKGLGLALGVPIISVPTVDAMGYLCYDAASLICPMMDARRNQVYTGVYAYNTTTKESYGQKEFQVVMPQCAMSIEEITAWLNQKQEPVLLLGDGIPVYETYLKENLAVPFAIAPPFMSRQRASSVAVLGLSYYKEGKYDSADAHQPDYLRLSQAERERQANQ